MNRRGFLKGMVAAAVAAVLTERKAVDEARQQIGIDMAAGADRTVVMEFGRIDGFRFIKPSDLKSVGQTWDEPANFAKVLEDAGWMSPTDKFKHFKEAGRG